MPILFSGFNVNNLFNAADHDYDLQCSPMPERLTTQTREEAVHDVVLFNEACFWLTGSTWKTASPEFSTPELNCITKISSSSQSLAAISKNGKVLMWNKDKWKPLNIYFPTQKRSFEECSSKELSGLDDNVYRTKKCSKINEESSSQAKLASGHSISNCILDDKSKDVARVECEHGRECPHCSICNVPCESQIGNPESLTSGPFIDVQIIEKKILLLDKAGDVWQGQLQPAPLCRLEALLLRHAVAEVCVGAQHCVLRTVQGQVFTHGHGMRGELGAGEVRYHEMPTVVPLLQGISIRKVVSGAWHCLALGALGEVFVWGWNLHGQLGLPCKAGHDSNSVFSCDTSSLFRPCNCGLDPSGDLISTVEVAHEAESSSAGACLEDKDDEVVNVQSSPVMLQAFGDKDVIDIAAGDQHSLFLLEDGVVWSCGWNKYGQCGVCWRSCQKKSLSPVPGLTSVSKIWAGFWSSAFLAPEPSL